MIFDGGGKQGLDRSPLGRAAWGDLAVGLAVGGCDALKPKYSGIDFTGASWGKDFRLADPDGRALRSPMPRFELSDAALQALLAHLRTLAAAPAPGWTPQGLVLQEVAPGVTAEEVQRLTEPTLHISPTLKTIEV